MIELSIIIVNYNSGSLLKECVESIQQSINESLNYEVIVVDNDSSDTSLQLLVNLEHVQIIQNKENLGFAKANNIGFKQSKGEIVHFLNPDTQINDDLVADYQYVLKGKKKKLYYNKIVDENGKGAKTNQLVYLLENYVRKIIKPTKVAYWNTGASILLHSDVFAEIGMWDERYFMYAEDMDLFYSAWRKGVDVEYLPAAIFHYSGGCSENVWTSKERQKKVDRSYKLFLKKYNRAWQYPVVKMLQAIYKNFG